MGMFENIQNENVRSLKLRDPVLAKPDDKVRDVVQAMRKLNLGCAIVVDDQRKPTGMFTESMLRRRWALVLRMLSLPHESLTFHSLRRSAASVAFNNNVSMEGIRNHGAWNSDSVYQYLFANSQRVREVPDMFKSLEVKMSKGS